MKTIEEILDEINEDKNENLSTTSYKFKRDLWAFFKDISGSNKMNAVEYGTHKGQTTRVLSHIFNRVYTINLPGHFDEAKLLNSDRSNIEYIGMDLYKSPIDQGITKHNITVFFVDAVHTFDAVIHDFTRSKNFSLTDVVYFVFNDYGLYEEVRHAVQQLIYLNQIELVTYIGHEPGYSFGGKPERILKEHEGIICKLVEFPDND